MLEGKQVLSIPKFVFPNGGVSGQGGGMAEES